MRRSPLPLIAILFCLGIALSSCFGGKDLPGEETPTILSNTEIVANESQTNESTEDNTQNSSDNSLEIGIDTGLFNPKQGSIPTFSGTTCSIQETNTERLPVLEPANYTETHNTPFLQISEKDIVSYTQINSPAGFKLEMVDGAKITVMVLSAMKSGEMIFQIRELEKQGSCFEYLIFNTIKYVPTPITTTKDTFYADTFSYNGSYTDYSNILQKYVNSLPKTCPATDSQFAANVFYFSNYANIDTAPAKYTFNLGNLTALQKWSSSYFARLEFNDGTNIKVTVANSTKSGQIRFVVNEILETGSCFNLQVSDVLEYQPESLTNYTVFNK
jgi:hypothetical protein